MTRLICSRATTFTWAALASLILASGSDAQTTGRMGLRFGAGADLSGGVAFGGQVDYTLPQGENAFELGLLGFGGKY